MTLPAYAMSQSSFPEMYERFVVGPLFQPWVDELLDRVRLAAGDRALDLACGTGIVARFAFGRVGDGGAIVGIDVSPQMLAVARSIAPGVEWREGNASALPVGEDEHFDALLCQQGFQFFSDKAAAALEMHRVLKPGGRLAVSTWLALEETPFFLDFHRLGERHVGKVNDDRFGLGDAARLAGHLEDAGFEDVRVGTVSRTVRFPDPETFVRMNAMAIVGMSAASATMREEERARAVDGIVADGRETLSRYLDGGELVFDISTNLATAARGPAETLHS